MFMGSIVHLNTIIHVLERLQTTSLTISQPLRALPILLTIIRAVTDSLIILFITRT